MSWPTSAISCLITVPSLIPCIVMVVLILMLLVIVTFSSSIAEVVLTMAPAFSLLWVSCSILSYPLSC
jgi:hypothetical protein